MSDLRPYNLYYEKLEKRQDQSMPPGPSKGRIYLFSFNYVQGCFIY